MFIVQKIETMQRLKENYFQLIVVFVKDDLK